MCVCGALIHCFDSKITGSELITHSATPERLLERAIPTGRLPVSPQDLPLSTASGRVLTHPPLLSQDGSPKERAEWRAHGMRLVAQVGGEGIDLNPEEEGTDLILDLDLDVDVDLRC